MRSDLKGGLFQSPGRQNAPYCGSLETLLRELERALLSADVRRLTLPLAAMGGRVELPPPEPSCREPKEGGLLTLPPANEVVMTKPVYLVVSLWIREGAVPAFEAYEHKVACIMKKYGGSVVHAVRPYTVGTPSDQPFEVHLVRFPSHEMFEAYRSDADLRALSSEREAVITRTTVLVGYENPAYAT